MDRYQKFGLCVALVIGLLVFMWIFATAMSKPKVQESKHLSPTQKSIDASKVESHGPSENAPSQY